MEISELTQRAQNGGRWFAKRLWPGGTADASRAFCVLWVPVLDECFAGASGRTSLSNGPDSRVFTPQVTSTLAEVKRRLIAIRDRVGQDKDGAGKPIVPKFHGYCAEVVAISRAHRALMKQGMNLTALQGARCVTIRIGLTDSTVKHRGGGGIRTKENFGDIFPPCHSCKRLMQTLRIEYAQ